VQILVQAVKEINLTRISTLRYSDFLQIRQPKRFVI